MTRAMMEKIFRCAMEMQATFDREELDDRELAAQEIMEHAFEWLKIDTEQREA